MDMKSAMSMKLDYDRIGLLVRLALEEDMGGGVDVTTASVVPEGTYALGRIVAREECVVAGLPVAREVFRQVDDGLEFAALVEDGDHLDGGAVLAEVKGKASGILTAERTALNFLQRLCGIATAASRYAKAVECYATKVLDTRKTTPGWRNLEKYAVATGGACNHRAGLYDRVLIKDNHRELAGLEGPGGIARSVRRAKEMFPELEVEVEADTLEELAEALDAGADYVLLDNMDDATVRRAVEINAGRARLEASGGITIGRLPALAAAGVDFISSGALTHSVRAVDISLEITPCTWSS